MSNSDDQEFKINDEGIAWESDKEYKFKNLEGDEWRQKQWLNVEDGKSLAKSSELN